MKWTRQLSPDTGWYWMRQGGGRPQVVWVQWRGQDAFMWQVGMVYEAAIDNRMRNVEWAGPIEKPQEASDEQ